MPTLSGKIFALFLLGRHGRPVLLALLGCAISIRCTVAGSAGGQPSCNKYVSPTPRKMQACACTEALIVGSSRLEESTRTVQVLLDSPFALLSEIHRRGKLSWTPDNICSPVRCAIDKPPVLMLLFFWEPFTMIILIAKGGVHDYPQGRSFEHTQYLKLKTKPSSFLRWLSNSWLACGKPATCEPCLYFT